MEVKCMKKDLINPEKKQIKFLGFILRLDLLILFN